MNELKMKLKKCVFLNEDQIMSKKKLEARITKIEKLENIFKLSVDIYDVNGMYYDEFEFDGFIYLENITTFDPFKSVKIVERKENITY